MTEKKIHTYVTKFIFRHGLNNGIRFHKFKNGDIISISVLVVSDRGGRNPEYVWRTQYEPLHSFTFPNRSPMLDPVGYGDTRRRAFSELRKKISEAKNPKIANVNRKMGV